MADDPRIDIAHAVPMVDMIDRLQITRLIRAGAEMVGPCPSCGGTDRFGIHLQKQIFYCRKCDAKGDQIALVQLVLGLDFPAALEWVAGPAQELTPAQRAEQERKRTEHRRRQAEVEDRMRARTINAARAVWFSATDPERTPVRDYLTRRGIDPARLPKLPVSLRYEREAKYMVEKPDRRGQYDVIHVGPAMVSAIVEPSGRLTAVHRTWLDLSQPKGKLILPDPSREGVILPAKKVLGSKKGGAIRFSTPRGCTEMVVGEGVETTLSPMIAARDPARSAYWCAIDLGNMSGRRKLGPGLKYAGIPDLDDRDAFLPPPWVKRLVFIQDGDSDPKLTRAKILAGLRRAMALRPGLKGAIAYPGDGIDMNDLLMGAVPISDSNTEAEHE